MSKLLPKTGIGVLVAMLTASALIAHATTGVNPPPPVEPPPATCPCITEYHAGGFVVRAQVLDVVRSRIVEAWVNGPGSRETSLAQFNLPIPANNLNLTGAISGRLAHVGAAAGQAKSDAESEVSNLDIVLQGPVNLALSAVALRSRAHAECSFPDSMTSGHSEIIGLSAIVDGLLQGNGNLAVSGRPNQTVDLPGGIRLIINEQIPLPHSGPGATRPRITVNALHVIVPRIADIVVSSAQSEVTCFCRPTT